MQKGFGVFFFKKIFLVALLFSCGKTEEPRGPYAQTCICPGPQVEPQDPKEPLVLNAANQKLADEMLDPKFLARMEIFSNDHSRPLLAAIQKDLSASISDGVLCIRYYSSDPPGSVRLLDDLIMAFEQEKNAPHQAMCRQKMLALDKEMQVEAVELKQLEDTFELFSDIKTLDSAELFHYGQVKIRLGHQIEKYTRLTRQKNDLQEEMKLGVFHLYQLEPPHYVNLSKSDHE